MRIRLFLTVLLGIFECELKIMEPFIVGGSFAKSIEDFPHVAFLFLSNSDGEYTCGSSILNQFILITAAHCTQDVTKITASVGNVNRNRGKPHAVQAYEMHKNWDERTCANDLALCKLKHPLVFGKNVKRILIMRYPPKTLKGQVAGWGAVEEKEYTDSDLLKHTDQVLWTFENCMMVLGPTVLPQGTICGGDLKGSTKFCSKGDSGSGLVVNSQVLVGIVSFKYTKVSRSLVVYTDAAHYYPWIKTVAEKLATRC